MTELSPEEKTFLDEAYALLKTSRRTLTEKEALHNALREGYELKLSFDERFARAEGRQGTILPHWRLAEQTLANTRLLNDLKSGLWDGQNLDEKLRTLDQEDQLHYTFYPHDPRLFQNRQGTWEATGERPITLPLGLKEDLDAFKKNLLARWSTQPTPLTTGQILTHLEDLDWTPDNLTSVHRYIRAWLLATEQFRRVGPDYWLPIAYLPPEIQHTRLQVPPIRTSAQAAAQNPLAENTADTPGNNPKGQYQREHIFFKGTVTRSQMSWVTTLYSSQQLEGFISIPKAVRGIYPPTTPGEESTSVLKGLWYEDAADLWLWLDRTHHRLYGPDLLDKIGWLAAGSKLRIEWSTDQIVLREAGLDPAVQQEETRLLDLEELKQLRGGIGESYRQSIQSLLLTTPDGLTFKEIVLTLSQQQNHAVSRRTIRSILYSGGFLQQEQRWFAAPNSQASAKALQTALLETLVDHEEESDQTVLSHNDYLRTRVKAIRQRLQEITTLLRENKKE
jgi:hypothetical protein